MQQAGTKEGSSFLTIGQTYILFLYEPPHEKTGYLPMRKQRSRSGPLFSLHG